MENLVFKPISIDDKKLITSFTWQSNNQNCDFSFANMCSWRFLYDSEFAVVDNMLLIRFYIEGGRVAYMMPVGEGDLKKAILLLENDSLSKGHPLCLLGITPGSITSLDRLFPGDFRFIPERDYFDYIYLRDDLVRLQGKRYQPKRNHINRFKSEYEFIYKPITSDILSDCLALESEWCMQNNCQENEALQDERQSLAYALLHFDQLGLTGGAIWIDEQIVAFSFGMPINHNTFGVHVEKANTSFDSIYAVINQQFASHIPEQYVYVNREEDLGIPGLRKAKLSYYPAILLEKNAAIKHR